MSDFVQAEQIAAQLAELNAISKALGTNEGHSSVEHIAALQSYNTKQAEKIASLEKANERLRFDLLKAQCDDRDKLVAQLAQKQQLLTEAEIALIDLRKAYDQANAAAGEMRQCLSNFNVAVAFVTGMRPGSENAFAKPIAQWGEICEGTCGTAILQELQELRAEISDLKAERQDLNAQLKAHGIY